MDCLFVLPAFHLLDLVLACSDAGARNTKRIRALIVLAVTTCVTCVEQKLQEASLDGRGTHAKAA
jgi:hypothetical protein